MTSQTKEKIGSLNDSAQKIAESYNELSAESEKHKDDKGCKELMLKVNKAYESCANQHQVAHEVFTQPDHNRNTQALQPLSYTVPRQTSKQKSYEVQSSPPSVVATWGSSNVNCTHCGIDCGN